MKFNVHSKFEGRHAFLSASKYHWLRYDEDKLVASFLSSQAAKEGTRLHAFAAECIELGVKLQRSNKTLNKFVNDAIGYGMTPEQMLFYSENAFGTADAIKFIPAKGRSKAKLLIFDLKTGVSKSSFDQLVVYAALFCLEYGYRPAELEYDFRIYQDDTIYYDDSTDFVEEVAHAFSSIRHFDKVIEKLKAGEY